jgi:hypothetical protein
MPTWTSSSRQTATHDESARRSGTERRRRTRASEERHDDFRRVTDGPDRQRRPIGLMHANGWARRASAAHRAQD